MQPVFVPGILGLVLLVPFLASTRSPGEAGHCSPGTQCDNKYIEDRRHDPAGESKLICDGQAGPPLEKEPQQWQHVADRPIKVFSAFYDRRPEAGGPTIRVVAAGLQAAYNDIGDIHCTLWYETTELGLSTRPAKYEVIYPSTMHADMWVSHFILCPLLPESRKLPYAVSITDKACAPATNQLLILNREEVKRTDTHALCISPMYGRFNDWEMLIEIIEIHKLLGAKEITTYNFSISAATNNVLQSYTSDTTSELNVIQWPFPPVKSNVWCQRGALNDCLYRMGHRHKYVTVTDMDEILVPRMTDTWPTLLEKINSPTRGIFMFQHAYFRRNTSGEEPYLVTQQSLWRTDQVVPPGKIRCKSMYKAETAVAIDLHFAFKLTAGTDEYIVSPEEGMLHHYRKTPMENFRKYPERFTFIEDSYMKRFKYPVLEAYSQRMEKVLKHAV